MAKQNKKIALLFGTWLLALTGASAILIHHSSKPGKAQAAPSAWPQASRILRSQSSPTLILFAHPECACTKATLAELRKLNDRESKKHLFKTYIVLVGMGKSAAAKATSLQSEIPGAEIVLDPSGDEAKIFGALTSGQTYLYSLAGEKIFQGGLTASRGHEGASFGTQFIRETLAGSGRIPSSLSTPVFGCALFSAGPLSPDNAHHLKRDQDHQHLIELEPSNANKTASHLHHGASQ